MNKISASAKSILLKALCTAMVIILGGSLFAAGAMGAEGCGMKCCCQTGPSHVKSSAEKQMRSPMGCCAGVPLSPCDIQAARPLELPEIILASSCDYLPEIGGTAVMINPAGDQLFIVGMGKYGQHGTRLNVSGPINCSRLWHRHCGCQYQILIIPMVTTANSGATRGCRASAR